MVEEGGSTKAMTRQNRGKHAEAEKDAKHHKHHPKHQKRPRSTEGEERKVCLSPFSCFLLAAMILSKTACWYAHSHTLQSGDACVLSPKIYKLRQNADIKTDL